MKKPKILFLVQLPPPVHGSSLANKLLVEDIHINNQYELEVLPIQMANDMSDIGHFSFSKLFNTLLLKLKLFRKLISNKYDLAYLTLSPLGFAFYKDALLIFILKLFNQKIVLHLHGKGIRKQTENRVKRFIYKSVFANTKVIILDELLYDDINNIYKEKPYVLPNGITDSPLQTVVKYNEIKTFIFLSNLSRNKGIWEFLEAIKLLQSKKEQFRAYIIGSPNDVKNEEVVRFLTLHNIHNTKLIGPVYGEKKYDFLNNSDIFVLPSKEECFPLTILESFQAGLAVISSTIGAIPNIVINNVNGFTILPGEPYLLAEKMLYLMEDEEALIKMKRNNIQAYKNKYTKNIFIANFMRIINDILKN